MFRMYEASVARLALVAIALFPAVAAHAAGLPNKPMRLIIPNAAAGPNDLVGRVVVPLVLVANPSVTANNVKELIADAKRAPGKLNIAVAGATGEIAGNLIKLLGGIDLNNVPYKGGAPAARLKEECLCT